MRSMAGWQRADDFARRQFHWGRPATLAPEVEVGTAWPYVERRPQKVDDSLQLSQLVVPLEQLPPRARRQLRHVPLQGEGRSARCKAEVGNLDDVVVEAQEQVGKAKVAVADVMCVKVAQGCEHMAAVASRLCPLQAPPALLANNQITGVAGAQLCAERP